MYKKNDIVKGKVSGIEKYGIFITLDDNYTGLIHISEISSKYVKNIFDYVQLGEIIKMKVLSIDEENKQIKLTIKDFDYRIGDKKTLEDQNGFSPLRDMLPKWIEEYEMKKEQ